MMDGNEPLTSIEDCIEYFRQGETPESDWLIGTEHEKIGIYADTQERVPYAGSQGIGVLLERMALRDGWQRVYEGEDVIGLAKGQASITLEPGGQIELSGAPLATLKETCREFNEHVDLLNDVSEDLGIVWLALGADPIHPVSEIPTMPKSRYEIMRNYLPQKGKLALDMMHATTTVQANYDFCDEADMATKLRVAMGCTAIVSAIFANSPIVAGADSGFVTKRVAIWRDTDPDRCGILHFVFDEGFGYREYVEWALDVPLFFLVRDGEYMPAKGTPFRSLMKNGFEGHHAIVSDWDLHLTTLFPEARLKRIIEVRGADGVPRDLVCALPALWKGLLYDSEACAAAWKLVEKFSSQEREDAQWAVARSALSARFGEYAVLDLARELVAIATEGLRRIGERKKILTDETTFLEPVTDVLTLGRSPGQSILEHWNTDWRQSLATLIQHAKY